MERTLLLSVEDWQTWYSNEVRAWGSDRCVIGWGDTDVPKEYPCIVVCVENFDENGYGFSCYDFIYKSDVEKLFQ